MICLEIKLLIKLQRPQKFTTINSEKVTNKHDKKYLKKDIYLQKKVTNGNFIDFNNNNSALFEFRQKITGKTGADGTKDVEITVPLNYLSNFCRILKASLINCEINLFLAWSNKCVLCNVAGRATTFAITDTNLYVLVLTLSTQDNVKLLKQFESDFIKSN